MKKLTSLITLGLLLCSLLAAKTQAAVDYSALDFSYKYTVATGNWTPTAPTANLDGFTHPTETSYDNNGGLVVKLKSLTLPNVANLNATKYVYLTLTYDSMNPDPALPVITITDPAGAVPTVVPDVAHPEGNSPWSWTYQWTITPQPATETLTFTPPFPLIQPGTHLLSLEVGTKCVPEPSTYLAGLSALGMLGLFGWRNRK